MANKISSLGLQNTPMKYIVRVTSGNLNNYRSTNTRVMPKYITQVSSGTTGNHHIFNNVFSRIFN